MLTVPMAARRVDRNPETIRRWIRAGKLSSIKIGTQHMIDQAELDALTSSDSDMLPLPAALQQTSGGAPMPDIVGVIGQGRRGR